ncbi:hypothetical protein QBC32DRAFT_265500 [Pseudoneurospora amorphoporcata]|uniref:Uncharacterized protein n=1 Tax=Pseudoneurospora amorphoporcata TaxID=241081 RepID=A0AAN6NQM6_9PEZI|nr:hypothetical protein QBC32DRAFT_265500 [Pseudoneurospora amorphoporcata]
MSAGSSPKLSPDSGSDLTADEVDQDVHMRILRYMLSSLQDHFGSETSKHRTPRFGLYDRYDEDDHFCPDFRLLFCDCNPRQDNRNGYQWQWRLFDIRITPEVASRFLELEPRLSADTSGPECFSRLPIQADKKLSRQFVLGELRSLLANAKQEVIPEAHIGTRTLRDILQRSFTKDTNYSVEFALHLSWVLGKSLGRFLDSCLAPRPWTEDTIEFLFQRESIEIIYVDPVVSVPADPEPLEDDNLAPTSGLGAQFVEDLKFPKIKALGVLLLQIWLRMPMAQLSSRHPGFFENGAVTRMGQLNLGHSLDTGILGHLPAELRPICRIIETCFDDEVPWDQYEILSSDSLARNNQIFKRIWIPLDDMLDAQKARQAGEGNEEEG